MIYIFLLLFIYIFEGHANLLHCDFEIPCADFEINDKWNFTNGLHSNIINHDHTLNNSSGIYLIFNSQNSSEFQLAEIKTYDWIEPSYDQAICFQLWYYTSYFQYSFHIQLIQGDDENLKRIITSIYEKDPSINDWTLINIRLPPEKVKITIYLNITYGSIAFDDLSVMFCNETQSLIPKILFSCNGESSCNEDIISLSNYPYQWSIIQANNAFQQDNHAPLIDYTFKNKSGHYFWLANSNLIQKGNVGYLEINKSLHITEDISYCLNFYYYGYGIPQMSHLKIYARLLEMPHIVQELWPKQNSNEYIYTFNQWTWAIINLPLGSYSLLFRMDSQYMNISSFALDNINIISCDYLPSEFLSSKTYLSFSCNFDKLSICDIENGYPMIIPSFNFTIMTGNTIPNRELGPLYDYTSNSLSGGFFYWNRQINLAPGDFGLFTISKAIEQNTGMCIKFAYYIKSSVKNNNQVTLLLRASICAFETLWNIESNDSQGWQLVIIPLYDYACAEIFQFGVFQDEPSEISVAFDDIIFDQCNLINTTNIITSTLSTSLTSTVMTISTTTNNSQQILSFNNLMSIIFYILFTYNREFF